MISVVMPAYNAEAYIAEAIESVLNQTYLRLELIIVDDGSTDQTRAIAERYAQEDSRIRIVVSEQNLGLAAACNLGIKAAQYLWVARLDTDDQALPERFEKQLRAAEAQPEVGVWGCYAYHVNYAGEILSVARVGVTTKEAFFERRRYGQLIHALHPSVMIRKDLLEKVGGYNEHLRTTQDLDLFDRLAEHTPILVIPEPLILYRVHGGSISMAKYFAQRRMVRWLEMRNRDRLAQRRSMTLGEFERWYRQRPIWVRLAHTVDDTGRMLYRRAGMYYGERRYGKMVQMLMMAGILNPPYVLARLWKQKFSGQARQWLEA